MNAKEITYDQFKEAIRLVYTGDDKIFSYYCPTIKVETVEDIVEDISKRCNNDFERIMIKGVYDKNNLIGYFVTCGGLLVSFGLSMSYRNRKFKHGLYALIKNHFKGLFMCYLWTNNQRAIGFLKKCGMVITESNNLITQLVCP